MAELTVTAVVLGAFLMKAAGILALSYAGARLAIRHERRAL
jgi:hypothetical protein